MDKKQFKLKDRIIKGISKDGHFKITVVKTTDVIKTARENHNLSLLNTIMLGKALTGVMLLASELKGEERIQLRFDGNGPIGYIIAEANSLGEIRGYVGRPEAELDYSDPATKLEDGIGLGLLTLSKVLYNEAEPRVSTIEIVKGDIVADIAHYLAQSEQVPSALLIDVGMNEEGEVTEAGGVLVQRLPDAEEGQIEKLQEKLKSFPPVHTLFEKDIYIDDIMHQVMEPMDVKELDRQPVDFFCRCTKDRFLDALSMLNVSDLKEMEGERQEIVCHYCNNHEYVSKEEISRLITEAQAKLN